MAPPFKAVFFSVTPPPNPTSPPYLVKNERSLTPMNNPLGVSHRGQRKNQNIFSLPRVVPCFPLLGLTPSGLFIGVSSTLIYPSELILCSTICVPSATRHNIHMYFYYKAMLEKISMQRTQQFSRLSLTSMYRK